MVNRSIAEDFALMIVHSLASTTGFVYENPTI